MGRGVGRLADTPARSSLVPVRLFGNHYGRNTVLVNVHCTQILPSVVCCLEPCRHVDILQPCLLTQSLQPLVPPLQQQQQQL
jgi:hypothetical protein